MKKFFIKFLLANFFITMIFSSCFVFFWNTAFVNASSPYKLWTTDIMSDTNDRIINKEVVWEKIQDSSFTKKIIPKIFKLTFYIATSFAVLSIIYWWYLMITSLWEDWQHWKWWKVFLYSIIWLILMLFSRAIVWIVSNLEITKWTRAEWEDYSLWDSSYIWNLPSWDIETEVIPQIIQLALQFVFVVIVWIIIYAWIMYITDPDKNKDKMSDLFINAVIWLIIILTSYVLVAWILKINFW